MNRRDKEQLKKRIKERTREHLRATNRIKAIASRDEQPFALCEKDRTERICGGTTISVGATFTPTDRTILISILDRSGHPAREAIVDSIQIRENGQSVRVSRLTPATDSGILFTMIAALLVTRVDG